MARYKPLSTHTAKALVLCLEDLEWLWSKLTSRETEDGIWQLGAFVIQAEHQGLGDELIECHGVQDFVDRLGARGVSVLDNVTIAVGALAFDIVIMPDYYYLNLSEAKPRHRITYDEIQRYLSGREALDGQTRVYLARRADIQTQLRDPEAVSLPSPRTSAIDVRDKTPLPEMAARNHVVGQHAAPLVVVHTAPLEKPVDRSGIWIALIGAGGLVLAAIIAAIVAILK